MKNGFDLDNLSKAQYCCRLRSKIEKVHEETLRELLAERASYDMIEYNNILFQGIISQVDDEVRVLKESDYRGDGK